MDTGILAFPLHLSKNYSLYPNICNMCLLVDISVSSYFPLCHQLNIMLRIGDSTTEIGGLKYMRNVPILIELPLFSAIHQCKQCQERQWDYHFTFPTFKTASMIRIKDNLLEFPFIYIGKVFTLLSDMSFISHTASSSIFKFNYHVYL